MLQNIKLHTQKYISTVSAANSGWLVATSTVNARIKAHHKKNDPVTWGGASCIHPVK